MTGAPPCKKPFHTSILAALLQYFQRPNSDTLIRFLFYSLPGLQVQGTPPESHHLAYGLSPRFQVLETLVLVFQVLLLSPRFQVRETLVLVFQVQVVL